MKRIYLTLGLVAGLFTAAQAQKEVDLEIKAIFPESNTNYLNAETGDVIQVVFTVTNNGSEDVTTSDTLRTSLGLGWLNADLEGFVWNARWGGLDIPVGSTDTLGYEFQNGVTELSDGTNQYILALPNDATVDSIMVRVYGVGYAGGTPEFFVDPGVTFPTDSTILIEGNNVDYIMGLTFGTVGVDEVVNNETALSVYPNPVQNGVLNIQYELKASAEVTVNVMDITGRVLSSENINAQAGVQKHAVNVANLSAGNYIVEISSTEGRGVSKFTVK